MGASETIRSQPSKALDAALFLVRHLLILKEVLASLEVDLRAREDEEGSSEGGFGRGAGASGSGSLRTPTTSRALEFAGVSSAVGAGGMTETLTNMLSRTTSLLPEGLFASLGVTRGVETDLRGVKMDIDQNLRKACEDVIASCSQPICEPLDAWVNSLKGPIPSVGVPATAGPPTALPTSTAQPHVDILLSSAPQTHLHFLEAVQRDLRSSVARVRLYLEDERTVRVLLEHVVERVGTAYELFGDALLGMKRAGLGSGDIEVMGSSALRDVLRDVCGDSSLSFAGYSKVP